MIDPESLFVDLFFSGLCLGIAIGIVIGAAARNANWREKAEDGTRIWSKGAFYHVIRLPPPN